MTNLFLLSLLFLSSCLSNSKHFLAKSKQGKYFLLETETKEAKPKQGTHRYGASLGNYQKRKETKTKETKPKQGTHKYRESSGDYQISC